MFGGFGMWEVILVFLVILLLFGARRLPEIGSSLGKGIREFKSSLREIEGELKLSDDEQSDRPEMPRSRAEPDDEPRKLTSSGSGSNSESAE